jgi:hypothetical protein
METSNLELVAKSREPLAKMADAMAADLLHKSSPVSSKGLLFKDLTELAHLIRVPSALVRAAHYKH